MQYYDTHQLAKQHHAYLLAEAEAERLMPRAEGQDDETNVRRQARKDAWWALFVRPAWRAL